MRPKASDKTGGRRKHTKAIHIAVIALSFAALMALTLLVIAASAYYTLPKAAPKTTHTIQTNTIMRNPPCQ